MFSFSVGWVAYFVVFSNVSLFEGYGSALAVFVEQENRCPPKLGGPLREVRYGFVGEQVQLPV